MRVRVLFPTAWDRQQLLARPEVWRDDFDVVFEAPDDAECPDDFDVLGYVERCTAAFRGDTDGVFSSSDYPGAAVSAAVGTALGLPASDPAVIMRAAHKGLSRAVQQACLPEATPPFQVLDLRGAPPALDAALGLPCWVKPAKGCFSVLARRVRSAAEFDVFVRMPEVRDYRERFLGVYCQLVQRYLGPDVDGTAFVAEGELRGTLVTVEGYATGAGAHALGVVDSIRHPTTGSFTAFEYPSVLPEPVQRRMEATACALAAAFGLRWTLFNVELMWERDTDRIGIVEINPRMCGQFADLYEKVDGVHGHRLALELACGIAPQLRRRAGSCAVAASYPLRTFEPVRVLRAPDGDAAERAAAAVPGALAWNEVHDGQELRDFAVGEDGHSCRYGVVNVGAGSREELVAARDRVLAALDYRFERLTRD
ncbi:MAG: acetyl-CoA carboxylase biotin carboxylase subunit family protein [Planctomycetota bacterium]